MRTLYVKVYIHHGNTWKLLEKKILKKIETRNLYTVFSPQS